MKWACQLYLLVQYVHARPVDVTHCPLGLVSNQMQKYKRKGCYDATRVCPPPQKIATWSDEYKRGSINSLSAAVCGGTVKNRQHIASMCGRVMFIHSQQGSFHRSLYKARASVAVRLVSVVKLPQKCDK